jgi:hypothetical protein
VAVALKGHEFSDAIRVRFAPVVKEQASLDKDRGQP